MREWEEKKREFERKQEEAKTVKEETKAPSKETKQDLTAGLLDDDQPQKEKKKRGPKVDESVQLKLCDLGNGCWTHHHFSSEIQTR